MKRRTAVVGLVGCALLTIPAGANTPPLVAAESGESASGSGEVADARIEASAAELAQEPVLVPAAATARDWAANGAAMVAPEQVPTVVLDAYTTAVALAPSSCNITVPLLAAVGQVESGNLVGRQLDDKHRVTPAMVGPRLDGGAFKAVPDTDGGRLDGDTEWDRAVGPMQFLPSTWRAVGVDIDGDGERDPQNIYDAAGAAMVYLCGDRDLSDPEQLRQAILAYNRSTDYLQQVLRWKATFEEDGLAAIASLPIFSATATAVAAVPGDAATLAAASANPSVQPAGPRGKQTPGARPTTGSPLSPGIPSGSPLLPGVVPAVPGAPSTGTPSPDAPPTGSPSAPPTTAPPAETPAVPVRVLVSSDRVLPETCSAAAPEPVSSTFFSRLFYSDADSSLAKHLDGLAFPSGVIEAPVASLCQAPVSEPSASPSASPTAE